MRNDDDGMDSETKELQESMRTAERREAGRSRRKFIKDTGTAIAAGVIVSEFADNTLGQRLEQSRALRPDAHEGNSDSPKPSGAVARFALRAGYGGYAAALAQEALSNEPMDNTYARSHNDEGNEAHSSPEFSRRNFLGLRWKKQGEGEHDKGVSR